MTKYNRSEIMKRAWEMKKRNTMRVGKIINDYNRLAFRTFASCLKQAWDEAKEAEKIRARKEAEAAKAAAAKKVEYVWIIPNWIMHEKELLGIRSNIVKQEAIERETVKAFRVYGEWIPKSVCERREVVA